MATSFPRRESRHVSGAGRELSSFPEGGSAREEYIAAIDSMEFVLCEALAISQYQAGGRPLLAFDGWVNTADAASVRLPTICCAPNFGAMSRLKAKRLEA